MNPLYIWVPWTWRNGFSIVLSVWWLGVGNTQRLSDICMSSLAHTPNRRTHRVPRILHEFVKETYIYKYIHKRIYSYNVHYYIHKTASSSRCWDEDAIATLKCPECICNSTNARFIANPQIRSRYPDLRLHQVNSG